MSFCLCFCIVFYIIIIIILAKNVAHVPHALTYLLDTFYVPLTRYYPPTPHPTPRPNINFFLKIVIRQVDIDANKYRYHCSLLAENCWNSWQLSLPIYLPTVTFVSTRTRHNFASRYEQLSIEECVCVCVCWGGGVNRHIPLTPYW